MCDDGNWYAPTAELADEETDFVVELLTSVSGATSSNKKATVAIYWADFQLIGITKFAAAYMLSPTKRTKVEEDMQQKYVVAEVKSRKNLWDGSCGAIPIQLAEAAARLLSIYVTACATFEQSLWGSTHTMACNRLAIEHAEKLIFMQRTSKTVTQRSGVTSH